MPFVQGKFDEDYVGIHYEDSKDVIPDLEFPPVESQDSSFEPDLTFPPVEAFDAAIVDLEFPSTDSGAAQQPLVDENESVGVLSRIRGWLGKE